MIMEWRFQIDAHYRLLIETLSILLSLSQFYPSVLMFGLLLPLKSYFTSVIYCFDISIVFKATFLQMQTHSAVSEQEHPQQVNR